MQIAFNILFLIWITLMAVDLMIAIWREKESDKINSNWNKIYKILIVVIGIAIITLATIK